MLLVFLLLFGLALCLLYRWKSANADYFEKRGVPHTKSSKFLKGVLDIVLQRRALFDMINQMYQKHNEPVFGIFNMRTPVYVIRNLDLIKKINIKDFEHFANHSHKFSDEADGDIMGNSLFSMRDARWKDMRSTLTPAFTGSKLSQMFALINPVAQNFIKHLKKEAQKIEGQELELDIKQHITRYTNDVIASTAFGLEVNSFEHADNEFYRMGKRVTKFDLLKTIKFFLFMHFRAIMKWLHLEVFEKHLIQYFSNLVLDAMLYRQQHNIHRPDMIQLLMEARGMLAAADSTHAHSRDWSDKEIVAQCFAFFFAGFETTSSLIALTLHELMENPACQQKLYEEIKSTHVELNGAALSNDVLHAMKYMDMVVSETLRKWPPNIFTDRECSKDISYEVEGIQLNLKAGEMIWIPTAGIQRDPQYFEEPDRFEPERFSAANRDKIIATTYMPFGAGPRICIGLRLALMECKVLLFNMLLNYSFVACSQTTTPMVLSTKGLQIAPRTGFWFKLLPRDRE